MLITSKDNNRIKEIRKLLTKKYSLEKGLFVIEGENLIEEAIKNHMLKELYVLEGTTCNYDFNYDYVTNDVMKSISDLKSTPRLLGISKINNNNFIGNKIVILDNIQDPGNAGTIIRSSVAFNADTVVFSKDSVSPYNEKVLRSTGGMIFNTNILIGNIEELIKEIKDKNIKVIGTSLKSSINNAFPLFVKTINARLKTQLKNNFSLCNIFIIPLQNIYETITKLTRNKNFDNIKNYETKRCVSGIR